MARTEEFKIKVDGIVQYVKVVESATKTTGNLGEKLKDVIRLDGQLSEQEKKNSERRQKSLKQIDDLHKSYETQYHSRIDNTAKMLAQSQKVSATISQINGLNEEAYKLLMKNNQEKMTAAQSEIDALAKNAKSVEAVTKAYEKKKLAIEEQAAIAQAEAETMYDVQIEQAKKAGKETVSLEAAKAEQVKRINEQLNKDLKKNTEEYTASHKTIFDKLVGTLSDNMEVYADTTSKKTKKQIQKVVKEAADLLGLEEEALKGVADGLLKTAAAEQKAAESAKAATTEVKATTDAAKTATAETKNTTDAAKTATAEVKGTTETAKAATTEVKKTTEEATKTSEATKKIVDIKATEENIKVIKQMLDSYRSDLKLTGQATIKYYDEQIKAADNVEKRKELEKKRAEAVKFYGEQLVAVSKAITAAEKKEQELGLLQWKQYAEKVQGVATSIKGITDQISGALGSAFTAVSNAYKAEMDRFDEKIKHWQNKNVEITKEIENQGKKVAALQTERDNVSKSNDQSALNDLDERLKKERDAYQQSLKDKETIEEKERELQRRKAKEQAKQEKIEKLNRKATLIKNIGEAIANVSQGVTKALSYGPFIGPVLAAVVAAAGAVQVGIMTKQLAKFEDGGLLRGKRHSQGGMRIEGTNMEVEGGEYIINRESTGKNLGLIRYINAERRQLTPSDINTFFDSRARGFESSFRQAFEQGGQLPVIEPVSNIDNESLIQAIKTIKIEPKVAVTDIHKVQDSMVSVSGWSGV